MEKAFRVHNRLQRMETYQVCVMPILVKWAKTQRLYRVVVQGLSGNITDLECQTWKVNVLLYCPVNREELFTSNSSHLFLKVYFHVQPSDLDQNGVGCSLHAPEHSDAFLWLPSSYYLWLEMETTTTTWVLKSQQALSEWMQWTFKLAMHSSCIRDPEILSNNNYLSY